MPDITVNGFDLATVGFRSANVDQYLAAPGFNLALAEVAGRDDTLRMGSTTPQPRRIAVAGWIRAADRATLRLYADRFKGRLRGGDLRVVFPDEPGRFIVGFAEQVTLPPIAPVYAQTAVNANWSLVCPDPHFYDADLTTVALSATAAAVPLGSGPVRPIVTISGPATDPVVIYRDSGGVERARMSFTGTSIGSGASIVLDCTRMTIISGAGVNMANALVGASRWIVLDPYHAAGPAGPWPTLAVTGLGTGGSAKVEYRRAWL